ncbi:host attachment family protein [Nitratireductor sp. StC3]|uniref:baeRF12 domain-containing protein n=1 Tax=Nitratireductor sp. StC3 TaxID=2126741 RepID=UPI000D0DBF49|nr:host attachment family protein [Nitratireductor sp. StC3]PSM19426.1 Host attachment protein [Nitratireductor sp. StC3]
MTLTKLQRGTWVLVADGEKALFLRNEGTAFEPALVVVDEARQENPATRDQGTDRPGRFNDGPNRHRSAVADTDWHRIAKDRFADDIADKLYRLAQKDAFKRIVLVAQPHVLGEIRKSLHKDVSARVTAEVAKTLTNHALDDIEKVLMED